MVRIVYVQKQGDQQYFIDQANGAESMAAELGAEITMVDVGDDANRAISEVDTAIARGVDAIAIAAPDQQIGPQVIERARQAGVLLLASDDQLLDAAGVPAPFVGFQGEAMGRLVGTTAGELFAEAGWNPAQTRVMRVSKEDLSACEDRANAATEAFRATSGADVQIVRVGTDATVVDSQNKAAAAITATPGARRWVVYGCNDESVVGAVTALQNSGVAPADIIGVGLGAYLTCKDWAAGLESGNKAALYLSGAEVGRSAVRALVDALRESAPLPPETVVSTEMVDATTWQQAGVACT